MILKTQKAETCTTSYEKCTCIWFIIELVRTKPPSPSFAIHSLNQLPMPLLKDILQYVKGILCFHYSNT